MNIVPRAIKASYDLKNIISFRTKCPQGLLPPKEYLGKQFNYLVKDWCVLTQSSTSGWECISQGTRLKFSNYPLKNKICPGANKLSITARTEDFIEIKLVREPCWEEPPEGFYFCKKHFNTYYGQYIRYVFGTAKPNKNNPFFKLPALLYTIFYGVSTLKVGTTILVKGFRRFMEQPYFLTTFLYIGSDIEVIRKLEVALSKNTSLSQAPRTRVRVKELREALIKDFIKARNKFVCKVMSNLEVLWKRSKMPEVKEIITGISARGFSVNDIRTREDDSLIQSLMPHSLDEVNNLLKNAECEIRSLSRGFLVMDCGKEVISIPYELLRDRLISLEHLK